MTILYIYSIYMHTTQFLERLGTQNTVIIIVIVDRKSCLIAKWNSFLQTLSSFQSEDREKQLILQIIWQAVHTSYRSNPLQHWHLTVWYNTAACCNQCGMCHKAFIANNSKKKNLKILMAHIKNKLIQT